MAQKCSGMAYLASFVARGARVNRYTVIQCFQVLSDYLEIMRRTDEKRATGPDRRAFMEYYIVAQALLYIFCFRWKDLLLRPGESAASAVEDSFKNIERDDYSDEDPNDILADEGELRWYPRFKEILQRNIFSILNPLRVCAPAIVSEFASISRHLRFIECLSKIESNKRLRLANTASYYGTPGGFDVGRRETAIDRKQGDAHLQLEPYFPFDPYHLPISKAWLDGDYNDWELPRDMRKDEDGEYILDNPSDLSDSDSDSGSEEEGEEGDGADEIAEEDEYATGSECATCSSTSDRDDDGDDDELY